MIKPPFSSTALRSRGVFRVSNRAYNHKIDYVAEVYYILNLTGNQNGIIGLKVKAILLKGWIFLIDGVASGRLVLYEGTCPTFLLGGRSMWN